MKKIYLLLASCFLMAGQGNSQIINAWNPEINVAGVVVNTGLAIAPFYHWQAMVSDDPSFSSYMIEWRDDNGVFLDSDMQPGYNPDVAYYSNADALVVAYENGGQIFVDDYYLAGWVNYNLNANNNVSNGTNPNVDMNSMGNGVLTWEDGGMVFACTFNIGTFTPGPIVAMAPGSNPDIILLDNNLEVILTYEQGGMLVIESYDHFALMSGAPAIINSHMIPPSGMGWELPRVASQRNSMFGPADDFTVVAQENNGGSLYTVGGFFFNGSASFTPQFVNQGVANCGNLAPKPVVAYERKFVDIAWAQKYAPSCVTFGGIGPGPWLDVLSARCDNMGNNIYGVTTYEEVNMIPLNFVGSSTSISTEYDGNYLINMTNYCEGVLFNDPGDMFWKKRDPAVPAWKMGDEGMEDPITVIKPVDSDEIKVIVKGTENAASDETAVFVLVDNTGREITMSAAIKQGDTYYLDASALSEGIYLLNCTVAGETTTARIPHFKQ